MRAAWLLLLVPTAAVAVEPKASDADPTQCTVNYDPNLTVELKQYAGDQVTLLFGRDEHFDVALRSDKERLEVVGKPGDNYLVAKSKGLAPWTIRPQQLMVRMTVDGDQPPRDYQIEYTSLKPTQPEPEAGALVASNTAEIPVREKPPEPKRCYVVRFLHPKEDAAAAKAKAQTGWVQAQRIKVEQELRRKQMNAANINVQYSFQGDRSIGPHGDPNGATLADRADIWDDGVHTLLHFPGNQRIPTFYTIEGNDKEKQALDITAEDNGIIKLPSVYSGIKLMMDGTKALCIWNNNVQDHNPQTGTSSADIVRGIRRER